LNSHLDYERLLDVRRKTIVLGILFLLFLGSLLLWLGESQSASKTRVFLIGIDGASWDIIRRLAAENKIPNLQKLMKRGASGYLDSISWRKKVDKGYGLFSPIIWSTIATGKLPSKHGVEDFRLPIPGVPNFQMGYDKKQGPAPSTLAFPFLVGDRMTVALTARLPQGLQQCRVEAFFNSHPIGEAKLEKNFKTFRFDIKPEFMNWNDNQLIFRYHDSFLVDDHYVAADVESIRIYNNAGIEVFDYCMVRDPRRFGSGWIYTRPTQLSLASSFHLRTRTLWEILSGLNRKVGVVGWWASWPAYQVNGYLVTSHVGLQGERLKIPKGQDFLSTVPDLTYPPKLLDEIRKIYYGKEEVIPDFEKRFFRLKQCGCVGINQEHIALTFFWQDKFFSDISKYLLKNKKDMDLFAVYFRGTDTMSHQFLGYSQGYDVVQNECSNSKFPGCDVKRLHDIIDNYYAFLDGEVGKILQEADSRTYIFVVTDHGEFALGRKGMHKNNGFIIAAGPGIRKHNFLKASVLDVVPTILYIMGFPIAQDMDGTVMKEAFDRNLMLERPLVYVDSYDKIIRPHAQEIIVDKKLDEEQTEELKALGYIN
jgi:predicted AlkP superfamily phosphohydrolase/phosphomutase